MECDTCRELKRLYGKEVKCCPYLPELMPENQAAIKIWQIVGNQRIYAGMDGTSVGLNQLTLWKAIEKYEIKDEIDCFEKVLMIYSHISGLEKLERPVRKGK